MRSDFYLLYILQVYMQLTVSICLIKYFHSLEMCRVIYIGQNKGVPNSFYIIAQSFQYKVKGELINPNEVPFMLLTFHITLCANIYQSQNEVKNIYILKNICTKTTLSISGDGYNNISIIQSHFNTPLPPKHHNRLRFLTFTLLLTEARHKNNITKMKNNHDKTSATLYNLSLSLILLSFSLAST